MHVSVYVCMCVCECICMYLCMYVCIRMAVLAFLVFPVSVNRAGRVNLEGCKGENIYEHVCVYVYV